jgi:predicted PurR-regulated permease PerM
MLLSGRTRLNALLVFVSVVGGMAVFDVIGLIFYGFRADIRTRG